jgi:hypothetical protein
MRVLAEAAALTLAVTAPAAGAPSLGSSGCPGFVPTRRPQDRDRPPHPRSTPGRHVKADAPPDPDPTPTRRR